MTAPERKEVMIPADMTPERLREDALILATLGYHRTAKRYVRWADKLEAAQPAPLTAAVPFPVGARVVDDDSDNDEIGEVLAVDGWYRWVRFDVAGAGSWRANRHIEQLAPAPTPMVEVPADVVARAVAGTLTDDDRAVLAHAGEGE